MNFIIKTLILAILCLSVLSSKTVSFGFESGNISLEIKESSSIDKNKTLNIKVNSFIKIHYIPNLEKSVLEELTKDNINIKFSLNDYEISIQKLNLWAREADDHLKKLIIDKYHKSIESVKSKDFSDRKIYLKNPFKLVYESNNEIHDIINYPKEFENYLYKEVFPRAFALNIQNFSHKFLLNIKNYGTRLKTNELVEKHDSNCKNAYQCRMAMDYSASKAKIIEHAYNQMNAFLQKEYKEVNLYVHHINMEKLKFKEEEFDGFVIISDIGASNHQSNLKKNELENFFIFNKVQNFNYYNTKQIWVLQSLDEFIKNNKAKKDDL